MFYKHQILLFHTCIQLRQFSSILYMKLSFQCPVQTLFQFYVKSFTCIYILDYNICGMASFFGVLSIMQRMKAKIFLMFLASIALRTLCYLPLPFTCSLLLLLLLLLDPPFTCSDQYLSLKFILRKSLIHVLPSAANLNVDIVEQVIFQTVIAKVGNQMLENQLQHVVCGLLCSCDKILQPILVLLSRLHEDLSQITLLSLFQFLIVLVHTIQE